MKIDFSIYVAYASSFNSSNVVIKAATDTICEEIAKHLFSDGYELYTIEPDDEEYAECCAYFDSYSISTGYYVGGFVPVAYKTRQDYIDDILPEL